MNTYPTHLVISYKDDREYRECLNKLFSFKKLYQECETQCVVQGTNTIEAVNDNFNESANIFLDFVLKKTKNCDQFKKLYNISAATMMCTNPNVGLTVLFSYTYLELFHKCLVHFFSNINDLEKYECYQTLLQIIRN